MTDNISENSSAEAKWYAIHTYSGYENKVKANIEKSVENRNMHHLIQKVVVLTEEGTEDDEQTEEIVNEADVSENVDDENSKPKAAKKTKSKKIVTHKLLPCYVMVKMIMNDESWYVVRNTRGVTGFVGPGSKPVPISDEEVAKLCIEKAAPIDFKIGDHVTINSGQMEGFTGTIESIDEENHRVSVRVFKFNKETSIEIDAGQVSLTY